MSEEMKQIKESLELLGWSIHEHLQALEELATSSIYWETKYWETNKIYNAHRKAARDKFEMFIRSLSASNPGK